jgi:hypothetical protein
VEVEGLSVIVLVVRVLSRRGDGGSSGGGDEGGSHRTDSRERAGTWESGRGCGGGRLRSETSGRDREVVIGSQPVLEDDLLGTRVGIPALLFKLNSRVDLLTPTRPSSFVRTFQSKTVEV